MKLTLAHIRQSRLPTTIGLCTGDTPRIAAAVNEAQQRLIFAAGETGFWGGWTRVAFSVTKANPYITLPRTLARVINLALSKSPIKIHNEFYEFLPGGIGEMPSPTEADWSGEMAGYERGTFPTLVDLPATEYLRVYVTDVRDVGKRILFSALDQNGNGIYSTDGADQVDGFFLRFAQPFVTSTFTISQLNKVQKDVTFGDVILKSVAADGTETSLARYAPSETHPSYRRYQFVSLPTCCTSTSSVAVTGLGKLEFIPVSVDTDYLIIGNLPALIEEAQALRYSSVESPDAAVLEIKHHRKAMKLLNDELRHYLGSSNMAVTIDRMQGASLEAAGIGTVQ